jgi:anion-transporting  ArsA/GET3 family ATPase
MEINLAYQTTGARFRFFTPASDLGEAFLKQSGSINVAIVAQLHPDQIANCNHCNFDAMNRKVFRPYRRILDRSG